MKILIAPNSMKNSLSAFQFADIIEEAFLNVNEAFKTKKIAIADGGDMTGEIIAKALNAKKVLVQVENAYGKIIKSKIFIKDELAIIEMADASGLKNCDNQNLNPLIASSYGTGQLINKAISLGVKKIYLGVGGSATVDGGAGMLEALGYKFYNDVQQIINGNGGNLRNIVNIIAPERNLDIEITIITDVNNPLMGKNGAANIFGYQKGAKDKHSIDILEEGLQNWATILCNYSNSKFIDKDGYGAAGGVSLPLVLLLNSKMVEGSNFILNLLSIDEAIEWSDIVITGEGSIDSQTVNNKAPIAIAQRANYFDKPIFAIAGKVEFIENSIFDGVFSIANGPITLENSLKNSEKLVFGTAFELAKVISKLKLNA